MAVLTKEKQDERVMKDKAAAAAPRLPQPRGKSSQAGRIHVGEAAAAVAKGQGEGVA